MQGPGLGPFPETLHLQPLPSQIRGSLNKRAPKHGALNCPVMTGILAVIREVMPQCTLEATVPCRKMIAADVVGDNPTQPTELLPDQERSPPGKDWVILWGATYHLGVQGSN